MLKMGNQKPDARDKRQEVRGQTRGVGSEKRETGD